MVIGSILVYKRRIQEILCELLFPVAYLSLPNVDRCSQENVKQNSKSKSNVSFRNIQGVSICQFGWDYWKDDNTPIVVVSHGNGHSLDNTYCWVLQSLANRLCLPVVSCWDYPGYGDSIGEPSETSVDESIQTVMTHFSTTKYQKFILVGQSIGSGCTLHWASRYADRCLAVVLITPFVSILQIKLPSFLCEILPLSGIDMWSKGEEKMKRITALTNQTLGPSVLILGAKQDKLIPFSHSQRLFDATITNIS